ncbi:unnamed protein product [Cyprideis torosa]|uniref:Uncharacterized protein n=1 Tax=Cyprideis torosa TaxID=163714 RepID=A0A7R8WKH0_9CRUS|nr:unnamed protein product [Cyprideis torosa]CAG0896090.1 unnamed protein product [Cyprideis torosa]
MTAREHPRRAQWAALTDCSPWLARTHHGALAEVPFFRASIRTTQLSLFSAVHKHGLFCKEIEDPAVTALELGTTEIIARKVSEVISRREISEKVNFPEGNSEFHCDRREKTKSTEKYF